MERKAMLNFPDRFISSSDLDAQQLAQVLDLAEAGKRSGWREQRAALSGQVVGLVFFNPSLRTRASFQAGIARLGGSSVVINASGNEAWQIEFADGVVMNADKAEHVREVAKVLSGYFDLVGVRAFAQMRSWQEDRCDRVLDSFARYLTRPLVSLESAMWHPCQALADALTLRERLGRELRGKRFVLTWANHPRALPMAVPNSAALIAAQMGMDVAIASPFAEPLDSTVLSQIRAQCELNGASFELHTSARDAADGAHVVYAKSWTPPHLVGRQAEEQELRAGLSGWMVDQELMSCTNSAIFMHCLPVRRNVVVADAVIDGAQSVIAQQAENRMHAQNALLLRMLRG